MGTIIKETKYMYFEFIEKKLKTDKYHVTNKKTDDILGIIEWYPYWRQYIFEPKYEYKFPCVFNHTCLSEIAEFLKELNVKHTEKKNQGL